MSKKIASVSISSFRGIPNHCGLDLLEKGSARSAIIYGGNGSGKSSIVDAIEFALQAKLGRSSSIKNPQRPYIFNLKPHHFDSPDITITLEDGAVCNRTVLIEEIKDGLRFTVSPKEMCEDFDKVPIALRRNDLTAFNNTKEVERQLLISQFIYQDTPAPRLDDDPVILSLEDSLLTEKKRKRDNLAKLCEILEVDCDEVEYSIKSSYRDYCNSLIAHNPRLSVSRNTGKRRKMVSYETYAKAQSYAVKCDNAKEKIKRINAQISRQKTARLTGDKNPITSRVEMVLEKSSSYLTSSFKELSNANYVKDIRLSVGNLTQVSFNIDVELSNGKTVSPTAIFSEANYDLMILLLYLSIIRVGVDMGQAPVLILDDVLQSVDANIRTNFVNYILRELPKWQLIITCHDRLWLEQLRFLFNLRGHAFKEYQIYNWSFDIGPMIKETKGHVVNNMLKEALETDNVRIIAAVSGPFLEMICDELSISLRCSIKRVPLDKYCLGDLWPAVKKALNKTELSTTADEIDTLLYIRNLLGCHFNQWANALSDEEVFRFANAIQALYEGTYCPVCFSWVKIAPSGTKEISCNCGHLSIYTGT